MTKRHRRHSTAKKREIVEAYLKGEALHALSKRSVNPGVKTGHAPAQY